MKASLLTARKYLASLQAWLGEQNRTNLKLVVLVLVGALVLRLENINSLSLAGLEFLSLIFSWSMPMTDYLSVDTGAESNGMLYYNAVLRPVFSLFSVNQLSMRLPSVLLGMVSLWLIYLIAYRLGGSRVGLLAILLYAANSISINASTFARFYALDNVLCLLSSYLLLLVLDNQFLGQTGSLKKTALWLGYVLCSWASLLSMVTSVFLLPVHWLTILLVLPDKRRAWRWVAGLAVSTIAICLILMYRDPQALSRAAGYQPISPKLLAFTTCHMLGTLCPSEGFSNRVFNTSLSLEPLNVFFSYATGILVLLGIWQIFKVAKAQISTPGNDDNRGSRTHRQAVAGIVAALWALVPYLGMIVFSLVFTPIIIAHNCLYIIPALSIVLGWYLSKHNRTLLQVWLLLFLACTPLAMSSFYCEDSSNQAQEQAWQTVYTNQSQAKSLAIAVDPVVAEVFFHKYCPNLTWGKDPHVTFYQVQEIESLLDAIHKQPRPLLVWVVGTPQLSRQIEERLELAASSQLNPHVIYYPADDMCLCWWTIR